MVSFFNADFPAWFYVKASLRETAAINSGVKPSKLQMPIAVILPGLPPF
jgi:hypothetical protein